MRQARDFCVCPHAHTTVDTPLVSLLPPILWAGGDASILAGSPFTNCLSANRLHHALLPLLRAGPQSPGHRVTAWHRRTASPQTPSGPLWSFDGGPPRWASSDLQLYAGHPQNGPMPSQASWEPPSEPPPMVLVMAWKTSKKAKS